MRNSAFKTGIFLLAFLGASSSLKSLPMFRNLYQARAGYKANCDVCHQRPDWRLTPYAKEYLRLGQGSLALKSLDVMDPDRDGFSSQEEIKAKANPGDPRSTPQHIGVWLADVKPAFPPKKFLSTVFGTNVVYQVLEDRLTPEQIQSLERFLNVPVRDEDRYSTVFVVREAKGAAGEGRVLGRAGYAYYGERDLTVLLVVLGPDPVLRAVQAVHVHGDQRLSKEDYLRQFSGKTYETLQGVAPPLGAESQNAVLLRAVRRSMKIMELATSPSPQ